MTGLKRLVVFSVTGALFLPAQSFALDFSYHFPSEVHQPPPIPMRAEPAPAREHTPTFAERPSPLRPEPVASTPVKSADQTKDSHTANTPTGEAYPQIPASAYTPPPAPGTTVTPKIDGTIKDQGEKFVATQIGTRIANAIRAGSGPIMGILIGVCWPTTANAPGHSDAQQRGDGSVTVPKQQP